MRTAAIIQARLGSTRYPGKVLDEIAGIPMLRHIIERERYAHEVDAIVVATTTSPDDRILLKRAREWQVIGFAGSEHDVLKRFVAAANLVEATLVVRLPADNPLFEPTFIDRCVEALRREKADFCYVEGCILGTGVEVVTVGALKKADSLATRPYEREHVNPYIMEHPGRFKIVTVTPEERYRMPEGVRLTVDTKEDIKLVRRIYRRLHQPDRIVSLGRTVELLKENPEWVGLNKDVFQKPPTSSEIEDAEAPAAEAPAAEAPAAEATESEADKTTEAEEPEEPAAAEPVSTGLRIAVSKPPENDKLDELMAEAISREEEEAKRKAEVPSLDDVLAKAQEEPRDSAAKAGALEELFGPEEAEEAEQTSGDEASGGEASGGEASGGETSGDETSGDEASGAEEGAPGTETTESADEADEGDEAGEADESEEPEPPGEPEPPAGGPV